MNLERAEKLEIFRTGRHGRDVVSRVLPVVKILFVGLSKIEATLRLAQSAPCREDEIAATTRAHRKEESVMRAMKMSTTKATIARCSTFAFALGTILFLGACAKKAAPPPPPPPPSMTAPTASLSANPNTLDQGQSTTLSWQTTNATSVSIDGIGPVDPSGSRQVTPAESTTYHLVAKGPGGTQDATARVTVNAAPAPPSTM